MAVNINQIMKQAQAMQEKFTAMQEVLASKEFSGTAGGGMVAVTLTGKTEMKALQIDVSLLKVDEKEVLEDLVIAAFNDAKKKIDDESQNSLSNAMGGMSLPPGFKMPF